jgi:hypothetical protein
MCWGNKSPQFVLCLLTYACTRTFYTSAKFETLYYSIICSVVCLMCVKMQVSCQSAVGFFLFPAMD